jgi:hypothetical protein
MVFKTSFNFDFFFWIRRELHPLSRGVGLGSLGILSNGLWMVESFDFCDWLLEEQMLGVLGLGSSDGSSNGL